MDGGFKVRSAPPESEMTKQQWASFQSYCNSQGEALVKMKDVKKRKKHNHVKMAPLRIEHDRLN